MLVLVEYPGVCCVFFLCVFFLCGGREGGGVGLVGFLYLWAGGSVGRLGGGVVLGWLSYCVAV